MTWPPPNYRPDLGTGYNVTFPDFQRLISHPDYRPPVAELLRAWFDYAIEGNGLRTRVLSADGAVVVDTLHRAIQADPQKQYELYQTATTLWR
jgi:hypothetical protein